MSQAGTIEAALQTMERAVGKEQHVLAERPDLTWQQLHNRLQRADQPLANRLATERERRSPPAAPSWVNWYTPPRESEALIQTLTHTNWVEGCAICPDGTWLATTSSDTTVKLWDVASGTERASRAPPSTRRTVVSMGSWQQRRQIHDPVAET